MTQKSQCNKENPCEKEERRHVHLYFPSQKGEADYIFVSEDGVATAAAFIIGKGADPTTSMNFLVGANKMGLLPDMAPDDQQTLARMIREQGDDLDAFMEKAGTRLINDLI